MLFLVQVLAVQKRVRMRSIFLDSLQYRERELGNPNQQVDTLEIEVLNRLMPLESVPEAAPCSLKVVSESPASHPP